MALLSGVTDQRDRFLDEKSMAFQQLSMADKAASMDILSCGLNHHMRNALTAVHTFFELVPLKLEKELGHPPCDAEFWGQFYDDARDQINRIEKILTKLWEASNSGNLKISNQIDVASLFRDAGTLILDGCDQIQFRIGGQISGAEIAGDEAKLYQLARLLFLEAKTHLGNSGNIEVLILPDSRIQGYSISFIDNGPPVAEEDLNRLFDAFFVRGDQPDEFGMNLVACYLIVFHHGGTMSAKTLPDGRNAIIFNLPAVPVTPVGNCRIFRDLIYERIAESPRMAFYP